MTVRFPEIIAQALAAADAALAGEVYQAIMAYAFQGIEPTELSPAAQAIFILAKDRISRGGSAPKPRKPKAKTSPKASATVAPEVAPAPEPLPTTPAPGHQPEHRQPAPSPAHESCRFISETYPAVAGALASLRRPQNPENWEPLVKTFSAQRCYNLKTKQDVTSYETDILFPPSRRRHHSAVGTPIQAHLSGRYATYQ